ncbi:hypothetical protein [Halobaculum marinum]|uniref:SH3 domain-containing protein n=1 Tax=Halobaculum marinum TaxID=3031996 RepID=A0ABD5X2Q6_9EURY|nr:hypothetical protein [Halobaculum sp. DT55]
MDEPIERIQNATVTYESERGDEYGLDGVAVEIYSGWVKITGGDGSNWVPRSRVFQIRTGAGRQ